MKKSINIFFLLSLLCLSNIGWTQDNRITIIDSTQFETTNKTHLKIDIEDLSFAEDNQPKFIGNTQVTKGKNSAVDNLNISVVSGDLHIRFDLSVAAEEYNVILDKIENVDTKKEFPLYPEYIYGDVGNHILSGKGKNKTIIIANNAKNSNPFLLSGKIIIWLKVEALSYRTHYGKFWRTKVKCNQPLIQWYQKEEIWIPPVVTTGVGVGLILWNKDYKPVYDQYKAYPRNIDDTEADYAEALRIERNERRKDAWGIGLIAASVAWIGIQYWRDCERKNTCMKYCCNGEEHCGQCKKQKKEDRKNKKIGMKLFDYSPDGIEFNNSALEINMAIGIAYTF